MLRVRLLGPLEADVAGRSVEQPASSRAWELLAWLALHPGEHPRGALAARFWPDVLDASARASLRSAAWALRRALGPEGADFLVAGRDRVGPALRDRSPGARRAPGGRRARGRGRAAPRAAPRRSRPGLGARGARPADREAERDPRAPRAGGADAGARGRARAAAPGARSARRGGGARPHGAPRRQRRPGGGAGRARPAGGAPAHAAGPRALGGDRARPPRGSAARRRVAAEAPGAVAGHRPRRRAGGAARDALRRRRRPRRGRDRQDAAGARGARARAGRRRPDRVVRGAGARRSRARTRCGPSCCATSPTTSPLPRPTRPGPTTSPSSRRHCRARLGRTSVAQGAPAAPEHARSRLLEAAVDAVEHAGADRPLVLLLDDVAPGRHRRASSSSPTCCGASPASASSRSSPAARRPQRPDLDALLRAHAGAAASCWRSTSCRCRATTSSASSRRSPSWRPDSARRSSPPPTATRCWPSRARGPPAAGRDGPPPSLQAVVRAAVGRLPDGARRAAELAAVAGRDLTLTEVGALASQEDVLRALDCGLLAVRARRLRLPPRAAARRRAGRHAPSRGAARCTRSSPGALRGPAAEIARHLRLAGRDDLAAGRLARAARDAVAGRRRRRGRRVPARGARAAPRRPVAHRRARRSRGLQRPAGRRRGRAAHHARPARAVRARRARRRPRAGGALVQRRALPPGGDDVAGAARDRRARPRRRRRSRRSSPAPSRSAPGAPRSRAACGRRRAARARLATLEVADPDVPASWPTRTRSARWPRTASTRRSSASSRSSGCRAPSPDRAYERPRRTSPASSPPLGRHEDALACADERLAEVRGMPSLLTPLHALRAKLLTRLGRLEAAREAVAQERVAARRSGDPSLPPWPITTPGWSPSRRAITRPRRRCSPAACDVRRRRSTARSPGSPIAESLARLGRADDAEAELREVTLEPVGPGDRPAALVARLTHVQALVARARGDEALAERRLQEAAAAWRRQPAQCRRRRHRHRARRPRPPDARARRAGARARARRTRASPRSPTRRAARAAVR